MPASAQRLSRQIPAVTLLLVPLMAFLCLLLSFPQLNVPLLAPHGHFYVVSAVAAITFGLSIVATFGCLRSSDVRGLWLALGFVGMTAIFAMHGLATPGFLLEPEYQGATGFLARVSVIVASGCMAGSVIDSPPALQKWLSRYRRGVLLCWTLLLLGFGTAVLTDPELVSGKLLSSQLVEDGTTALVLVLAAFAAWHYLLSYRRSGLGAYGAFAIAAVLVGEAQLAMHFSVVWTLAWWIYHFQLLAGYSAMAWAFLDQYGRGRGPLDLLQAITSNDPYTQIRAGYTEGMIALAASLEARDGYTLGHGERVAALAVLIGTRLRLSNDRIGGLARGTLLHDVGKIAIPDDVLHKSGRLDDDEFEVIKGHPAHGASILAATLPNSTQLGIVRGHHERFDGTGYPAGLRGEAISLEARIVAVADVYDALRSHRAYRGALSSEDASRVIRESSGTHFDPRCVEAFLEVVEAWETRHADPVTPYAQRRYA